MAPGQEAIDWTRVLADWGHVDEQPKGGVSGTPGMCLWEGCAVVLIE